MKTTITHNRNEPGTIKVSELPGGVSAILLARAPSINGELIYRSQRDGTAYYVSRPGDKCFAEKAKCIPLTEPVSVTFGPTGNGSVDVPVTEPAPIPMSDMEPGDIGMVAGSPDGAEVGLLCSAECYPSNNTIVSFVGSETKRAGVMANRYVHILQPGESLLIERLPNEPVKPNAPDEPVGTVGSESAPRRCQHCKHRSTAVHARPCSDGCYNLHGHKHFECADTDEARAANPDTTDDEPPHGLNFDGTTHVDVASDGTGAIVSADQFERLEDGVTRKECGNCLDEHTMSGPVCLGAMRKQPKDARGMHGWAHPCWRPIEPTLDDALGGTAEEIVAALRAEVVEHGEHTNTAELNRLVRAIAGKWTQDWVGPTKHQLDLEHAICSGNTTEGDIHAAITAFGHPSAMLLARNFVELRDRLWLFGEVENATD